MTFRHKFGLATAALVVSIADSQAHSQAQAETVDEYRLKAAFLYNFARFVEWPAQTFKTANDPIVICVLGPNPFGNALEETISGKTVEGRKLVLRRISDLQPACNCQMLFVNASERKRFRSTMGDLRGSGILTVGETPGFAAEGGVINFKMEGGRVRFEINLAAMALAHVRISSKLLSLAEIVKE